MRLFYPHYFQSLRPALKNIIQQLSFVPYLDEIIIGLDRANEQEYRFALQFFKTKSKTSILWNDGLMQAIHKKLDKHGLAPKQAGKGRNVWYCMGYVLAGTKAEASAA